MSVAISEGSDLAVTIQKWVSEETRRMWKAQSQAGVTVAHTITNLTPQANYRVLLDGAQATRGKTDALGRCSFAFRVEPGKEHGVDFRYAK